MITPQGIRDELLHLENLILICKRAEPEMDRFDWELRCYEGGGECSVASQVLMGADKGRVAGREDQDLHTHLKRMRDLDGSLGRISKHVIWLGSSGPAAGSMY
ncbi:unnamed protein product [Prunus armeniaca]|uniref:Uncharacterized protein n=1 Tax=Prunus armeniaca TaxID=36596 RepID=A0A6J5XJJ7_PRUAR|nr:unnamed protein product [Prunus armeniaca]